MPHIPGFIEVHQDDIPYLMAVAHIITVTPKLHQGDPLQDPHETWIEQSGQPGLGEGLNSAILVTESYPEVLNLILAAQTGITSSGLPAGFKLKTAKQQYNPEPDLDPDPDPDRSA